MSVPQDPRPTRWPKYRVFLGIFLTVVIADQVTKFQAVSHLTSAFDHHGAATFRDRLVVFFAERNFDGEPASVRTPDLRKPPVVVNRHFWNLKYVENPGAAWGMFSGQAQWFRVPFFHIVSIVAITFMSVYIRRLESGQRLLLVALSLVLGGAVGNYIDRLLRTYVIDFIDWHWFDNPRLHWPTFNIADAAICVGVALMIGETLFTRRRVPATENERGPEAAAAAARE